MARALDKWEPLIEIKFDRRKVKDTIHSFGEVVDQIEDHEFTPPPVDKLRQPFADRSTVRFGTHVCRNCDARFSCASYRVYMRQGKGRADQAFEQYYSDLESGGPLEEWRTVGLDSMGEIKEML